MFQSRTDIELLSSLRNKSLQSDIERIASIPSWLKDRINSIISEEEARLRAKTENVLSINSKVVGIILN